MNIVHLVNVDPYRSNRINFQINIINNPESHISIISLVNPRTFLHTNKHKIISIPDFPKTKSNDVCIVKFLKRGINAGIKVLSLLYVLFFRVEKSSVLHAHENSTLFGLYIWTVILRRKGVWDPHDYFHEVMPKRHLPRVWMEKRIIKRHIPTIVVSTGMQKIYHELYPEITTFLVRNLFFRNCNSKKVFSYPESKKNKETIVSHSLKLIYFGQLKEDRLEIDLIFEFLKIKELELHLYGYFVTNNYESTIMKLVNLPDSNIYYKGMYSAENIISILKEYHFAIFPFPIVRKNIDFGLPNKFFQCIEARLPMIISNMKEMSALVEEFKLGYTFPDRNYIFLKKIIASLDVQSENYSTMIRNIIMFEDKYIDYDIERRTLLDTYTK